MRNKSSSDPMIRRTRYSRNPRHRHLNTVSGETFWERSTNDSHICNVVESSPPCCVAGEHFLTTSNRGFLSRSLSIDSIVDITDISGDEEMLATTYSLRRCQTTVLRPYMWLLLLISWKPFGKERIIKYPYFWKFVNIVYPVFVVLLLWYSNIMQAITCHGKLNPKTDVISKPLATLIPATYGFTTENNTQISTMPVSYDNLNPLNETSNQTITVNNLQCSHIITIYVVPSILHFLAFLYGFHYFRMQENEQLYSLMERVFVQAQTTIGVQEILIRNSRLFLLAAALWLILNIGLEVLYLFAFELEVSSFTQYLRVDSTYTKDFLIFMRFVGLVMTQGINIAVVINYCTQCEMLIMHIRGICLHLHEKTTDIKDAMHEILGMKEFISLLNGTLGKMTGLCVIGFVELIVIGIGLLLFNQVNKPIVWSYRLIFLNMWLIATMFPLIQAARVSKIGRKLRQVSLEMRVFGYQAATQLELDSFILFINTATLRAKLFGIEIKPGSIVLTIIFSCSILLLIIIIDLVPISNYWRAL